MEQSIVLPGKLLGLSVHHQMSTLVKKHHEKANVMIDEQAFGVHGVTLPRPSAEHPNQERCSRPARVRKRDPCEEQLQKPPPVAANKSALASGCQNRFGIGENLPQRAEQQSGFRVPMEKGGSNG